MATDKEVTVVPLTKKERADWENHQKVIKHGIECVIDVGLSLADVRMRNLYREDFPTFDAYCESIDTSKQRVSQLIQAGRAARMLTKAGIDVKNESQARALLGVTPQEMPDVWAEASSEGKATTAKIMQVIRDRKPTPPPPPTNSHGEPAHTDLVGNVLENDSLIEAFNKAGLIDDMIEDVKALHNDLLAFAGEEYGAWVSKPDIEPLNILDFARPFALCPYCGNAGGEGCKACKRQGWVPKIAYKAAPPDLKRSEPKPIQEEEVEGNTLEEF